MYSVRFDLLQTTVLQRCHMESSPVVTTTELKQYINDSGTELNDLLARAYGAKYTTKLKTFALQGNKDTYDLSADIGAPDFMLLQGIDVQTSGQRWLPIREFKLDERAYFQLPSYNMTVFGPIFAYRFQGNSIVFAPMPLAAFQMRMFYAPTWTILVNDTDTVDVIDGWHEYIIVDVCIKILAKQDLPCDIFMAQKAAMLQRIEAIKQQRDASAPPRISDTSNDSTMEWLNTYGRIFGV